MRIYSVIVFFLLLISGSLFAQETKEPITVIGDELRGYKVDGESVREVTGNVVITQNNIVINCDKAFQYLENNNARLLGNVVVNQDSITITTEEGYYYGNEKRAFSDAGLKLDDQKVVLTAAHGSYSFITHKAEFKDDVTFTDTASVLTSDNLWYFRKENKAIAFGSVEIVDSANQILADSLIHYRQDKITYAFDNIRITNHQDNITIFGDHLIDKRIEQYTKVDVHPILMQIDTSQTGIIDTFIVKASLLEAFRGSENKLIATDSVQLLRGNFASKNDYTLFLRDTENIVTHKVDEESESPVMWYDNTQLTGDTIIVDLQGNTIEKLTVLQNGLITSHGTLYQNRKDQMSGKKIVLHFDNSDLQKTELFGGVLCIYYLYEDDKPNGLIKASAQNAVLEFNEDKVDKVKMLENIDTEFHPEKLVEENVRQFLLPTYKEYGGRPQNETLLKIIRVRQEIIKTIHTKD